ncbi:hypothetical protein Hanom_Chr01g00083211 [Helianthus anomalus]
MIAKIPKSDGYTRNPTQMRWVCLIPGGYWDGYEISFKNFHGYGSGMGLGDTQPNYPKSHTRLAKLYTRFFQFIFLFSTNTFLLVIYFSMFTMRK